MILYSCKYSCLCVAREVGVAVNVQEHSLTKLCHFDEKKAQAVDGRYIMTKGRQVSNLYGYTCEKLTHSINSNRSWEEIVRAPLCVGSSLK